MNSTSAVQLDAVVFDIGNVLLDWDARRVYRAIGMDDAAIQSFFDEVGFTDWNLEQDRGRTFADGVAALSAQFPHHADTIARYDTHWLDSVPGPIQGTLDIFNSLIEQDVPVHAITNFSAEKFAVSAERWPFLTQFGVRIVSGEEKLIKPDAAIYRTLLARTGLAAERTVFIDDSAKNVAGAEAVGMHAIAFTTPSDLREALRGFELPGGATV